MNLRRIDLNLLVAFDALMHTRHVSRAAAHLGIGQPGMSAALGRLRQLFDDPLLVRQGSEMVPTERALALQPDIQKLLRDVENILAPPQAFSPETSDRVFRLRMSGLLSVLLLPALVGHASRTARIRASILRIYHQPQPSMRWLVVVDLSLVWAFLARRSWKAGMANPGGGPITA